MTELRAGLYESLLTSKLGRQLGANADLDPVLRAVDLAEQPEVLARHVREAAFRTLSAQRDPAKRVELVNALLGVLDQADDAASGDPRQLLSLSRPAVSGTTPLSIVRPTIPLSDAALLTNAPLEPSLGAEVRAELETADQVELLCAFVKWHGLRVLDFELKRLRERNKPMRVVTTTYMGATERRALDRLVLEFGAEVKIQYDAQRTRLHAKAWLFRRDTQFDTAYVGSSNLSRAALLDGVEWNVRLSRIATPTLMAKFIATFDSYWNDATFETYDPDRDRDRLDDALAEASGLRGVGGGRSSRSPVWRFGPTRTRRRCWNPLRWNATCTTGTGTSSSLPPAPARRSSRHWTTGVCANPNSKTDHHCSSWRTVKRS
jgi:HKD family nuclease